MGLLATQLPSTHPLPSPLLGPTSLLSASHHLCLRPQREALLRFAALVPGPVLAAKPVLGRWEEGAWLQADVAVLEWR